jgi:hypothetical protein
MANDKGHISTVDQVHIKKLETEFVILGFEAICTSCLTNKLCEKVDLKQWMNPDNDLNFNRYKLCSPDVFQVGVFRFEIGVDWPVTLEYGVPQAGGGAGGRNQQQWFRHVFLTDTSKKHHFLNGYIRRVDNSELNVSIHCVMKLLNTSDDRSLVKQTAIGDGGMYIMRPRAEVRAPFWATLPEIFDSSEGWLHEGGKLRVVYQLSMATEHDLTKVPCPKAETCDGLLEMLTMGNWDVTLRVGDPPMDIVAHACVLGARSPVFFARMFESNSDLEVELGFSDSESGAEEEEEGGPKIVVLEDFDPQAVHDMVRYMYGGEVPDTSLENDEQIILLMTAANWFEVESLVDRSFGSYVTGSPSKRSLSSSRSRTI